MTIIHNLDLNLIRIFDALMEERGATRAGERLGLTQSAVSHALNKLRHLVDDELFVRGPNGMHPTPRAEELARPLRAALRQIEDAFSDAQFEARSADASFVIATSDYIIGTIFPSFMRYLEQEAPGIRVWLRPFNDLNIVEGLDRGTLHLVLGSFGRVPARFIREPLITEPNVWVMRADHPAAHEPVTLETLASYPHVDILISGRGAMTAGGTVDEEGLERAYVTSNPLNLEGQLAERGLSRRVGATVSHVLAVPPLVAATDMLAFIPRRLALQMKAYGLIACDPPYPSPPLQIAMLSHRTMGAHPSVAWLRGALRVLIDSKRLTDA